MWKHCLNQDLAGGSVEPSKNQLGAFQMAEVAKPREHFAVNLRRIDRLKPTPIPS